MLFRYLKLHLGLGVFKLFQSHWFEQSDVEQFQGGHFAALHPYFAQNGVHLRLSEQGAKGKSVAVLLKRKVRNGNTTCANIKPKNNNNNNKVGYKKLGGSTFDDSTIPNQRKRG